MNTAGHRAERATIIRLTERKSFWAKGAICAAMVLMGSLASAAIVVETGSDNTGTDNVLANACDRPLTSPALTVQGCLTTDHSYFINFTSDESIAYSGGQASIVAADDGFSFITIGLAAPDSTFNKVLLSIDAIDDGFVTFIGSSGAASSPWALNKNGQNKFILTGEDFQSISLETTVGIGSLKQVGIGGLKVPGTPDNPGSPDNPGIPDNPGTPDAALPIPGTLLLLGLGLGLFGLRETRRADGSWTRG